MNYHDINAISASRLRDILVSPTQYWAKHISKRLPEKSSDAMDTGTAYHKAILEGWDKFDEMFCPSFDPAKYPKAIQTADDMRTACRKMGLPTSGTKQALTERLKEAEPCLLFMDDLRAQYAEDNAGKIPASDELIENIRFAMQALDASGLSRFISGGEPEKVLQWTEKMRGPDDSVEVVDCKAMLDYLRDDCIIDLKTILPRYDISFERRCLNAIIYNGYGIQAAWYRRAVRRVLKKELPFYFIFVEQGPCPNIAAFRYADESMGVTMEYYRKAESDIASALGKFVHCRKTYGDQFWPTKIYEDLSAAHFLDDNEFPIYMKGI